MPRRMRISYLAAALTAALGFTTVVSPDASAAETCPIDKYCVYDGPDYTNRLIVSEDPFVEWIGHRANDKASSIVNNTNLDLEVFPDVNFGGFSWENFDGIVHRHSRVSLARPTVNDNKVSSYFLYG